MSVCRSAGAARRPADRARRRGGEPDPAPALRRSVCAWRRRAGRHRPGHPGGTAAPLPRPRRERCGARRGACWSLAPAPSGRAQQLLPSLTARPWCTGAPRGMALATAPREAVIVLATTLHCDGAAVADLLRRCCCADHARGMGASLRDRTGGPVRGLCRRPGAVVRSARADRGPPGWCARCRLAYRGPRAPPPAPMRIVLGRARVAAAGVVRTDRCRRRSRCAPAARTSRRGARRGLRGPGRGHRHAGPAPAWE